MIGLKQKNMELYCHYKISLALIIYICIIGTCRSATLNVNNATKGAIPPNSEVGVAKNIRCYCNLPECIQNGYMCKSEEGVCFSKYKRKHHSEIPDLGCLELMEENHKTVCRRKARLAETSTNDSSSDEPFFECCLLNVCNFGTTRHYSPTVQPKQDSINHVSTVQSGWWKVLTISVPLGGSMIFIALVIFAAKMLSQESKLKESKQGVYRTYCPPMYYKRTPSHPERESPFCTGVLNPAMSSSTIYSKDFADSLQETLPLTCKFQGNTL